MTPPVEEAHDVSLTELLPEVLNKIGEHLANDEDVLLQRNLFSFASTSKVIKAAVKDALDKLEVDNRSARALLVKCGTTVEELVEERPTRLHWINKGLVAADVPALINVLKSEAAMIELLGEVLHFEKPHFFLAREALMSARAVQGDDNKQGGDVRTVRVKRYDGPTGPIYKRTLFKWTQPKDSTKPGKWRRQKRWDSVRKLLEDLELLEDLVDAPLARGISSTATTLLPHGATLLPPLSVCARGLDVWQFGGVPHLKPGAQNEIIELALAPVGTRVALDVTTLTIMRKLPREVDPTVFQMVSEEPGKVSFSSVGGLNEQIRELREVRQLRSSR